MRSKVNPFGQLFRSLSKVINQVKSQKDSQILFDKVIKIMLRMANHSSKTLSWNLLETELEDLRTMASVDQIVQWLSDKETNGRVRI